MIWYAIHRVHFKIGCIVVLLRSISPVRGLSHETRLKAISFHSSAIVWSPLHSPEKRVIFPRIELAPSKSTAPFTLRWRQFPIRLAYAMTIIKSQGQTFDRIGLSLSSPVFTQGQLYVALARVRNQSDVKVELIPTPQRGQHYICPVFWPTASFIEKFLVSNVIWCLKLLL